MFSGKTTGREGMGFFTTALFPFSPHPCLPRVRSQATITISSPVNHGTITQEGNHIQTVLGLIERFSYDLEKLFGKCSFYQPMDEKIKTWTLRFPTKTLIWTGHCSIGQSCYSMTSKRNIDLFLKSSRA